MGDTMQESGARDSGASPRERVRTFLDILLEEDLSEEASVALKHLQSSKAAIDSVEADELATLLLEELK